MGINITPMVDVVLVLLVIMMVSSTYIVSQSLKVELPKSASSDAAVSAPTMVTVTKDGAYLFNQEPAESDEALSSLFRRAFAENPDTNLVVTADTAALHGKVIHAIDLARQAGITKFAISVSRD
ncbi:Biopolymer transport protein ExbD/TolR [Vulgatibacter incomptus]|uniref:Biopolymer transport protein ExbD/TolR n=1 Tax=Vulgatibacter incomptus TaxID=1391653 RepID=A0A0K1PF05_9BACT|nr:Biopolymer transport protein ExbD/TolR [Vulgatibacter incomptus]